MPLDASQDPANDPAQRQETHRLRVLREYGVLDTLPEQALDDLTRLAARLCDAPMALISLVDQDRHWFKSRVGVAVEEAPREASLCDVAMRGDDVFVVDEPCADPRFAANPFVQGERPVRFYAGAPLKAAGGEPLGTLCVLDIRRRTFDAEQRETLLALARQVSTHFELARQNRALAAATADLRCERAQLQRTQARLEANERRMALVLEESLDGWWDWDLATGERYYSPRGWAMLGYADGPPPGADGAWTRHIHPDDRRRARQVFRDTLRGGGQHCQVEIRLRHRDGHAVPVLSRGYVSRDAQGRAVRFSGTNTDVGDIRAAEAHEREVRGEYAALFANSIDGVLRTRPDGTILDANAAAREMLGWDLASIRALGREGVLDASDPRLAVLVAERRATGSTRGEARMRRADGSTFEVELSSAIYRAQDGGTVAHVVFRDITDRLRWQQELQQSLSLLNTLAQRVPGVLFQYRLYPDGRSGFPFASEGIRAIYEVTPEQVREDANAVFQRLHPDDLPAVAAAIAESARTLQPWSQEYRVVLPVQGECWRQGSAQPERLPDGSVLWHGFISDITERKRAEGDLRRLNRAMRVLGSCNLKLHAFEDERGYLEEVCRAVVSAGDYRMGWIGYAAHDPAKSVEVMASAGHVDGYFDEVRVSWDASQPNGRGPTGTAIRTGDVQINIDSATNPALAPWLDAALRRGYRASVSAPLVVGDEVIGALTLYAADTSTFSADDRPLLAELGRSIGAGVETLRSRRERDAAQVASRTKSAFLANMSHEIRTPLNALIGMIDLMLDEGATPVQAGRLKKMDEASRHLLALLNDVLEVSKIEAGSVKFEQVDFALADVLGGVEAMLQEAARAKGLAFTVDDAAGPLTLRGDPTRLRQALLNLASNAVKFTERGSVAVRVERVQGAEGAEGAEGAKGDAGTVTLRFSVRDSGPGLPPDQLGRLFQPFEQADASVSHRVGGTGLGLAITRGLAQLMGGEAGAESTVGKGSTFWFTAVLRRGRRVDAPRGPAVEAPRAGPVGERIRGRRVLLAEDNEVNREILVAMLEGLGLQVDTAVDGVAALQRCERTRYDLVLMDVQMPGLDGMEATRAIRRLPGWRRVPIVALTAYTFREDRDACRAAGMDDFIPKPVDRQALRAKIVRWLDDATPVGP